MAKKKTTALARRSKKTSPKRSGSKKKAAKKKTSKPTSTRSTAIARRSAKGALPELPTVASDQFSLAALGASRLKLTPSQREALMAPWSDTAVSIRPDGIVYVEANKHRDRLTEVFGPGQWSEIPVGELGYENELIAQEWALLIQGVGVTRSMGGCEWKPSNRRMTKDDAVEGAKSNALTRNCKGIMNQDWRDKRWAYQFRLKHGVYVHYKDWRGNQEGWRHVDDPPLEKERGIVDGSPNQDRYRVPGMAQRTAARPQPRRAENAEEQQAASSQALTVSNPDAVIGSSAVRQIGQLMETHGRTVQEVRGFLEQQYGIRSRTKIKRKDFNDVVRWIQAPYDVVREGEVLPPEGQS